MVIKDKKHNVADAIRALSACAVDFANSGHPGMPMGMADIAQVLWLNHLKHDPAHPQWPNRDRFVLSNGHGSMLLYALLHLTGYDLSIEDIKAFRKLHSKTPGHPEYFETPGVETSTGPLGQGFANAVGMAIAEHVLSLQFNTDQHSVVDYHTYVFLGDGCLMEGISHEAASMAGHLRLKKLIAFYDHNSITIDGATDQTFTEDTKMRFTAYGWDVYEVDGHHKEKIDQAIVKAKASNKPVLIMCKTIIGYGAPNKQGLKSSHGSPLGTHETKQFCASIAWQHEPFKIPQYLYAQADARPAGKKIHASWQRLFDKYAAANPQKAAQFSQRQNIKSSHNLLADLQEWASLQSKKMDLLATRQTSQKIHAYLTPNMPELFGGSADLAASNLTTNEHTLFLNAAGSSKAPNTIHFGVREFSMVAIANGMALCGFFRPYVATFLIFSDYARNAIRMSALMRLGLIYIMTHDSIGLGEDGPTHQPIEQLSSLRLIPNLNVWRPCDFKESAVAWASAIASKKTPTLMALSRQKLPQITCDAPWEDMQKGGYTLLKSIKIPQVVLIATGSEVVIALDAAQLLIKKHQLCVSVVSMPCMEIFDQQSDAYKKQVIPHQAMCVVAIEAGSTGLWYKYVGRSGHVVGIDRFGASGNAEALYEFFKITPAHVVAICVDKIKHTQDQH